MGALGFHVDEPGRFAEGALGAEDDAVAIVGAAVGHIIAFRTANLVAGKIGRGEEFDFGDDNGLVMGGDGVGRGIGDVIGGDEEGVGGRVEDASFMEVGSSRVLFDAGMTPYQSVSHPGTAASGNSGRTSIRSCRDGADPRRDRNES